MHCAGRRGNSHRSILIGERERRREAEGADLGGLDEGEQEAPQLGVDVPQEELEARIRDPQKRVPAALFSVEQLRYKAE